METVLIAALVVVAAAGLYVALTFNRRTRQSTAPLIDAALSDLHDQLRATSDELRRQLQAITEDLHRDRDEQRLEGRKIQGRLDHADSRITSMSSQFLAELAVIKRHGEQASAQQGRLGTDVRRLAAQLSGEPEPAQGAVPGRLYVERLRFSVTGAPAPSRTSGEVAIVAERSVAVLPPEALRDLGDAVTAISRSENDAGFRDRLAEAASDYAAARWGDPAFAAVTEQWITQGTFGAAAAAEVGNRIGAGLAALMARPLDATGTGIQLPGPAAAPAGTGADLILQPLARPLAPPLGEAAGFCEIVGVAAGVVTGLHPLALAAAKLLAHDESQEELARAIRQAARTVFAGPQPAAPPDRLEPASPAQAPTRATEIPRTWARPLSPLPDPLPSRPRPDGPPDLPHPGERPGLRRRDEPPGPSVRGFR
jgi:hypothetical protein